MKFDIEKVNGQTAGLFIISESTGTAIINGNVEMLESVLRSYSHICGEKTKRRLIDAIIGRQLVISRMGFAFSVRITLLVLP